MGAILGCLTHETDFAVKGHAVEVTKMLLDPENMSSDQTQEKNLFLNMFYEHFVEKLAAALEPKATQGDRLHFRVLRADSTISSSFLYYPFSYVF